MVNRIPNKVSHISAASLPDSDNSSTANISNGGTFTGAWTQVDVGSRLILAVKADQNLTIQIQYSPDGTNADSTITRYYRTAQIEPPHIFINARPYYRIVVTNNSGSDTTTLRVNAYISQESGILNIPVDSTMSQDYDSISVRPTGFTEEVALGRRQGWSLWNKFGFNEAVSNSDEVVASWGGTFQYLTAGETISIVSDSTADDLVGTGAQQLIIYGIDSNWDQAIEVVEMDGTTPAVTTSTWIGINRVSIYAAGTGLKNAGTITVTASSSGYTMAQMPTGLGTTQQVVFYVPRNHQALATWLYFDALKDSGGGNPEITFKGFVYSDVAGAEYEVYRDALDTQVDNRINLTPPEPFVIGEKSVFWVTANSSTGVSVARGRLSLKLVRDVDA